VIVETKVHRRANHIDEGESGNGNGKT